VSVSDGASECVNECVSECASVDLVSDCVSELRFLTSRTSSKVTNLTDTRTSY
jgi:hypothetical protein